MSQRRPIPPENGRSHADVVVVGAGPAGSIAALLLARQGLDVLLLDRADFPRPKPCGDCLSAGATALFRRHRLLAPVLDTHPARLHGWRVVGPGDQAIAGRITGDPAIAIERAVLDDLLLRAATAAGARFAACHVRDLVRDPATGRVRGVVGDGPGREPVRHAARLVVGADGLRSVVARRLGVLRRAPRLHKVSLTTHVRLPDGGSDGGSDGGPDGGPEAGPDGGPGAPEPAVAPGLGEMHVLDGACLGFAPVGRGRYNLTLVVERGLAGPLRTDGAEAFVRGWVERVPVLHRRLDGVPMEAFLASGPFDWPTRSATAHGAALVGDAAGYYDPFTGQGVHHGMAAAELLAEAVAPALRAGASVHRADRLDPALRAYDARRRALVAPARRLQWVIEAVLSRPRVARPVLRRLGRAPALVDRLLAVTGDLLPARSLISPLLLSTLYAPTPTENP